MVVLGMLALSWLAVVLAIYGGMSYCATFGDSPRLRSPEYCRAGWLWRSMTLPCPSERCWTNIDGFVKSPSAALRFIFRHCDVPHVRLIPQDSRALHLELFTVPCRLFAGFLRVHQH